MALNSKRRIAALTGVLAVALTATACGSSDDGGGSDSSSSGTSSIDCAPYKAFGDLNGKTVTVYTSITAPEDAPHQASYKPFEECTGVTIKYEGSKEFEAQLPVRVKGGNAPDIAYLPQPGLLATMVATGQGALDTAPQGTGDALVAGEQLLEHEIVGAEGTARAPGGARRRQQLRTADRVTAALLLAVGDEHDVGRGAGLVETVSALRARPGGDIGIMGSASVVRALLADDLVDELNLMIEPIILGGGKTSRLYKRLVFDQRIATEMVASQASREAASRTKIFPPSGSSSVFNRAFAAWTFSVSASRMNTRRAPSNGRLAARRTTSRTCPIVVKAPSGSTSERSGCSPRRARSSARASPPATSAAPNLRATVRLPTPGGP